MQVGIFKTWLTDIPLTPPVIMQINIPVKTFTRITTQTHQNNRNNSTHMLIFKENKQPKNQ